MLIRQPYADEVEAICALFADEVRAGRMLPRRPEEMRARLGDWLVAEAYEEVIGCVSLVPFNASLCELRSLAVDPAYRGQGIGGQLITAAVEMARTRGMHRVLALTRAVHVFEQAGFRRDFIANYPEKVWHDCALCPFRQACDEVALIYDFELALPVPAGDLVGEMSADGLHQEEA